MYCGGDGTRRFWRCAVRHRENAERYRATEKGRANERRTHVRKRVRERTARIQRLEELLS